MQYINILFLAIIIGLQFSSCKSHSQDAGDNKTFCFSINNKKYVLVKERKNWEDAAACAIKRSGYLAEINDVYEQTAMFNALMESSVSPTYCPVNDGGGTSYIWIGATDKDNEGLWIWDGNNDGSGITFWKGQGAAGSNNGTAEENSFVFWGGASAGKYNEPDDFNTNQDAAAIALAGWPGGSDRLGAAGEWNDIKGSNELYFLIETDSLISSKSSENNPIIIDTGHKPCKDTLFLNTSKKITGIKVYNAKGILLHDYENQITSGAAIDISYLDSGRYFLLIIGTENSYYTFEFSKE